MPCSSLWAAMKAATATGPWALPPVLGRGVGLRRRRERSGDAGLVGDRGLVAAPGVPTEGGGPDEPPEELTAAGSLVGPAVLILEDLPLHGRLERLSQAVVRTA